MSKSDGVLGKACSGSAARSFHPYWSDVSPVRASKSHKQVVAETWDFIKGEARKRQELKGRKVWRNGEFAIL